MAISIVCRSCGEVFDVPASEAGGLADCAICGAENPVPRRRRRRSPEGAGVREADRPGLSRTVTGLTLILAGISIALIFVTLLLVARAIDADDLARLLEMVAPVVMIGYPLLRIVGESFCLSVPERSRAQGLVTAALVLDAISILVQLLLVFGTFRLTFEELGLLGFGFLLLSLAGTALFLLFVARTAHWLREDGVERNAMAALFSGGGLLGLYLVITVIALARPDGDPAVFALVLGVVILVLAIYFLLKYVGSISGLRTAAKAAL